MPSIKRQALAIANNDLVYLWWTYQGKIDDCLGFSVRRLEKGKPPKALPAFVGFEEVPVGDPPPKRKTTDTWPIQSYQWKDLFVPEDVEVRYEIVPMKGTPGKKLTPIPGLAVKTNRITAADRIGDHTVIFNRGIISTQALTKALQVAGGGAPSKAALTKHIAKPGDPIRTRLTGEALGAFTSMLTRGATDGGKCFCALYELADPELIDAIEAAKGHVEVILANADGSKKDPVTHKDVKVYDKTNAKARKRLHKVLGPAMHDRLLAKGNYIGHNKFIVYVDAAGTPKSVLTGSTNWTSSGLCAQTNNVLVLESEAVASVYLDYWQRLLADDAKQGPALRTADAKPLDELSLGSKQGKVRIWFSPNTKQKSKPAKNPPAPPDMAELFEAIGKAEHGVLFLLFSAGAPSILQRLREVDAERKADGREFFVRGAISDSRTSREFATRVYNDSLLKGPNTLITGIAGVPDQFAYWEAELAKLGHAVIHDKLVVVDPFSDGCLVAAGSHNLGFKASYSNDENLCLIRGNRAIAQAYAAHVLDVVNHYNWRYNLGPGKKKPPAAAAASKRFTHLAKSDRWQDKYFRGSFLASRDRFFFPPS